MEAFFFHIFLWKIVFMKDKFEIIFIEDKFFFIIQGIDFLFWYNIIYIYIYIYI